MPRPCKCRWIGAEPSVSAFKPCGVPARTLEAVELGRDELEAIRLADLDGLYQDAAAERMGVSRATFGRLVERARHKVACALLQSKMLLIKGGIVMNRSLRTFVCSECGAAFQAAHGAGRPAECPSCHSKNFHRAAEDRGRGCAGGRGAGSTGSPGRGCCRRRRGSVASGRVVEAAPAGPAKEEIK